MRIIFVNTNRQWGGGEKWHYDTALYLKNKGHEVAVISNRNTELFNKALKNGIRVIHARVTNLSFINPILMFRLVKIFKTKKPEIVILNFSSDVKAAGTAARVSGIHHVIYRRGNSKPVKNTFLNRMLFRHVVTGMIANSEETKRSVLKTNDRLFPAEKISVIYNGIDLKAYDALGENTLYRRKDEEIILGTAGRLSVEKGHRMLLETALILKQRRIKFILLVAGDGPELSELKKYATEQQLGEQVLFLGFVRNIKEFMNSIDIFVLPSRWEGFGYVTIEAMAAYKPVIAFNTGSNPEVITNQTGFLVDNFDTLLLAETINTLCLQPELRNEMGIKGRKRVEQHFDASVTDRRIEQFLKEL